MRFGTVTATSTRSCIDALLHVADGHEGSAVEDDLIKAQRYRVLARQMRDTAEQEQHENRRNALTDLAAQYDRLVDQLIGRHTNPRTS